MPCLEKQLIPTAKTKPLLTYSNVRQACTLHQKRISAQNVDHCIHPGSRCLLSHQTGRQFDKDGNLVEWWNQEVTDAFKEKAQCIIDQYGNYVMPQINKKV